MKTRTKSIPEQLKSQAETYVGDLSDIVFFDIETTGLSHKTAFLYLVGAAFMESGRFVLCQYLAEDLSEEEAVLKAFSERIHGKKRLIHFNGSTFDLPFLQARCRKYGLECAASAMEQTDLYRRISPLKNVLKLSNCKLKTLEEFLGSGRKDPFTGGELIELYHTYRREKDERLLEVLLLHNAEDILGMLSVLSMLAYPALSEAQAGAGKAELSPCTDYAGKEQKELLLPVRFPLPLPRPLALHADGIFFSGNGETGLIKVPVFCGELKYFYPTDTLVTGYDIIFFWVARMIFSGMEHMGEPPFKTVFIHGLIRDAQGRKMSKSLGNGIDPLEVIAQYGADALRFTLVTGNSPGNDLRFSQEKVEASRNFANKIWNASRFILMNIDGHDVPNQLPEKLALEDKWIVNQFNQVVKEVTDNLEHFEIGIAVQKLYDFLWDELCDWYIEIAKIRLQSSDESAAQAARQVLVWVMTGTLQLLHPFMPYITEEIWQSLPHEGESIMVSKWPVYEEAHCFQQAASDMQGIMDVIRAVRNRRSEMNVPPSRKTHLYIATAAEKVFQEGAPIIERLAFANGVEIGPAFEIEGAVNIVTSGAKAYIPMDELVDKKAELARLTKELESAQKQYATTQQKLSNEKFLSKAPENVGEGVRQNAAKLKEHIALIQSSIDALSK